MTRPKVDQCRRRGPGQLVRSLGTAALAGAIALGAPAGAESPHLQRGIQLYNELEFEKALGALQTAAADPKVAPAERALALVYAGMIHVALGNPDAGREAWLWALEANPRVVLPADASPRIRAQFEAFRPPPPEPLRLDVPATLPPAGPLSIRVAAARRTATRGRIAWRAPGEAMYKAMDLAAAPEGGWAASITVPPGAAAIELYVEALDERGGVVARAGSREAPIRIATADASPVAPAGEKSAGGAGMSWGVWAGVGAAVLAAAAVTVVLVLSGQDSCKTSRGTGCVDVALQALAPQRAPGPIPPGVRW